MKIKKEEALRFFDWADKHRPIQLLSTAILTDENHKQGQFALEFEWKNGSDKSQYVLYFELE